jgi:hypothetical protein
MAGLTFNPTSLTRQSRAWPNSCSPLPAQKKKQGGNRRTRTLGPAITIGGAANKPRPLIIFADNDYHGEPTGKPLFT